MRGGIDLIEEFVHEVPVKLRFLEDRGVGAVLEQQPSGVG